MKRILVLFIVISVFLTLGIPVNADEYIWANASDWAVDELKNAEAAGLIPESLNNQDLTKSVTREEFAEISVKAYENIVNAEAETPDVNPFKDTENENILKAYNLGITKGTTDTTFEPSLPISREEAATMLSRVYMRAYAVEKLPEAYKTEKFSDHDEISEWAIPSVYFMADNGIIAGIGNGKFAPVRKKVAGDELYGEATREQALLISVRLVDKFKFVESDNDNPPAVDGSIENEIAEEKEDYRIVFIGGSLTQGGSGSWIAEVKKMFAEKFPDKNIVCYNAGVGGTTSVLGAVRYKEDVLSYDPDLVFVEFSVNDYYLDETDSKMYMEAMVKQSLKHRKIPAMVFLHAPYPVVEGKGRYPDWKRGVDAKDVLAQRYGIKTINIYDYMVRDYKKLAADNPELDFFNDYLGEMYNRTSPAEYDVHGGYVKYGEAVREAFEKNFDACLTVPKKASAITDSATTSAKYRYVYANSGKMHYTNGWTKYTMDNYYLTDVAHSIDRIRVQYPYYPNGVYQTTTMGAMFGYNTTAGTKAIALGTLTSNLGAEVTVYVDDVEAGVLTCNLASSQIKAVSDWIELPKDNKPHKVIFKVRSTAGNLVFRFGSVIEKY